GLVSVAADRHLELTDEGRRLATRVMRKHRLAECLLVDVIGLEWEQVHAEACRWEHVMSEAVERRVLELLRHPTESPYGNPIPGLEELGETDGADPFLDEGMVSLADLDPGNEGKTVVVRRIGEPIQTDAQLMYTLRRAGVQPGSVVSVTSSAGAGVVVGSSGEQAGRQPDVASQVFVAKPCAGPGGPSPDTSLTSRANRVPADRGGRAARIRTATDVIPSFRRSS